MNSNLRMLASYERSELDKNDDFGMRNWIAGEEEISSMTLHKLKETLKIERNGRIYP